MLVSLRGCAETFKRFGSLEITGSGPEVELVEGGRVAGLRGWDIAQLRGASVGKSLLDRIESEALDGDVVKALRLCIMLGGRSESVELREWAARELRGYDPDDELLGYRRIGAPLCVDGLTQGAVFTGQTISVLQLPDFAQGDLSEELELRYPISELQDMTRAAEQKGESVRLAPPLATELLLYMNRSGTYNASLQRLYWQVAPTMIKGVVDRVCTDIIGLAGEIRAGMHRGHDLPSADLAAQAFSVVVKGTGNRVVVKNVRQASENTSPDEVPTRRRRTSGHSVDRRDRQRNCWRCDTRHSVAGLRIAEALSLTSESKSQASLEGCVRPAALR